MAETSTSIAAHPASFDYDNSVYASVSGSYPISNGFTDAESDSYASFNLAQGSEAETFIFYNFGLSIPADAVINSISLKAKGYISNTGAARVAIRQIQMCIGTTPVGTSANLTTTPTAFTLTQELLTAEQLNLATIRIYAKRGTSNVTSAYIARFYGATLEVAYTYEGSSVYVKSNGAWIGVPGVYKKVGGVWVEQSDPSAAFENGKIFIKG